MNIKNNKEFWDELGEGVRKRLQADTTHREKARHGAAQDPEFVLTLLQELRAEDASTRRRAAHALVSLGAPSHPKVFETLLEYLRDDDLGVREESVRLVAQLGAVTTRHPGMADALMHAARDDNSSVRQWAVVALGPVARNPKIRSVLCALADQDPSAPVCAEAREVLRDTRSLSEKVAASLVEQGEETASKVVRSIERWLKSTPALSPFRSPQKDANSRQSAEGSLRPVFSFKTRPAEETYVDKGQGTFEDIRYRIRQATTSERRELIVETRLDPDEEAYVIVLITLRDEEMEGLTLSAENLPCPPIYLLLQKQGTWATGRLQLIPGVGQPLSIVRVEPDDILLEQADTLRLSYLAQIAEVSQTGHSWRSWMDRMTTSAVREAIEKEFPDEQDPSD